MIDLGFYFKLVKRRLPAMAGLVLLASGIGIVVALRQPNIYQTRATLLVEGPQIASDIARSGTEVGPTEQLDVVQQRLLTRANLINVARTNKVFPDQQAMNPDAIVNAMLWQTRIQRSSGRDKATVMTISFTGATPQMVADVVNQYVTIVLSTNSTARAERAEGTMAFFNQEVQALSENLDTQGARIVEFKTRNSAALPESLSYRMTRQSLLLERQARDERDLAGLVAQRAGIQSLYDATGRVAAPSTANTTPEAKRLQTLQFDLSVALGVYSEQSPKVQLLRDQIAALEGQIAASAPLQPDSQPASPLDASLTDLDARIAQLKNEITRTTNELALLEQAIAATPTNQIALEAMERDLSNTQSLYAAAVQRQAQARMGERVELSSKGEQITVLEPASVPNGPSGPNRTAIAGTGFAVGLGLAAGLFLLLEVLNQSIRRVSDIKTSLDITALASIPRFETAESRRWRRTLQLASLVAVIVAVPASLWAIDTYYMPLDQLLAKVAARLI